MKFYDTCSLLLAQEKAFEENEIFGICSVTLKEIENIKTSANKDSEIKFKARKLVKLLDKNSDKYKVYFPKIELLNDFNLDVSNDNLIAITAYELSKNQNIIFYSDDICLKTIAREIVGLNVRSISDENEDIYKGYVLISGDADYINDYMNNIDYSKWFINEYLIIEDIDTNKFTEMRFNGESFVSLKLPPSAYIKAKNSLQRCALDLMLNKDITISAILGGYGSGKTYIATQMALYNVLEKGNQAKILGIRECSGEGKDIGYLKGTFEDKTGRFFKPIEQQLKGGEYELTSLISRGVLETNIPFYLKGTTYNETIMVVDEAEDLTESQIRLIGTRLGENSKIYFSGDYNQSLLNKTLNNPLMKMCNQLKGSSLFGCIVLDEDVRSETSKIFANFFVE